MKTEKNKIILLLGEIENQTGDVVINWCNNEFERGNQNFYSLITKAGVQPINAIATFKANIKSGYLKEGDVVSTIAGLLNFNLILHALLDTPPKSYNLSWLNIIQTIKVYKDKNLCNTVYLTVPDLASSDNFIKEFFQYQSIIEGVTFIFMFRVKSEKDFLEKKIMKIGKKYFVKESKILKFENKLFKYFTKFKLTEKK